MEKTKPTTATKPWKGECFRAQLSFHRGDENLGFEVPAATAKLLHELHPGKRAALIQLQGLMVPGFVGVASGDGKIGEMVEWTINPALRGLISDRKAQAEADQLGGASVEALRAALEKAESDESSDKKTGS